MHSSRTDGESGASVLSAGHSGERDALLALTCTEGMGPAAMRDLLRSGKSFRDTLADRSSSDLAELQARAGAITASCARTGTTWLTLVDDDYPPALRELHLPPPVIYLQGNANLLKLPAVAIVGTRGMTRYGERVAAAIAEQVAGAGFVVLSGLARGIDSVAHRAALRVGGHTCAVLGTGADVVYPSQHRSLQREIAGKGLLVTEFPPGQRAVQSAFPRRNRIIAALSLQVCVVEAGQPSGALITALYAVELNRTVSAVPGPIDAPASAGCNTLLRDGANVVSSVDEVLEMPGMPPAPARRAHRVSLTEPEARVLGLIGQGRRTEDSLVEASGLQPRECLALLSQLEVAGHVKRSLNGEVYCSTMT